jgi:hypothetical protein
MMLMSAGLLIAHAVCAQNSEEEWQPMSTAPRDGTVVELMNTYGVAPWYSIAKWTRHIDGVPTFYGDKGQQGVTSMDMPEPHWVSLDHNGFQDDADTLHWRPYHGSVSHYVDPTGGAQNSNAYWLRATGR